MSWPCQGSSDGKATTPLLRTKLKHGSEEVFAVEELLPARYITRGRNRLRLSPRSCALRVRAKRRRLLFTGAARRGARSRLAQLPGRRGHRRCCRKCCDALLSSSWRRACFFPCFTAKCLCCAARRNRQVCRACAAFAWCWGARGLSLLALLIMSDQAPALGRRQGSLSLPQGHGATKLAQCSVVSAGQDRR